MGALVSSVPWLLALPLLAAVLGPMGRAGPWASLASMILGFGLGLWILDSDPSQLRVVVLIGVAALGQLHALSSRAAEPLGRCFGLLGLSTVAAGLVLGSERPVALLVGWQGLTVCGYLAVGFWGTDPSKVERALEGLGAGLLGEAALAIGVCSLALGADQPPVAWTSGALLFAALVRAGQLPVTSRLADALSAPAPLAALTFGLGSSWTALHLADRALSSLSGPGAELAGAVVAAVGAASALYGAAVAAFEVEVGRWMAHLLIARLGLAFVLLGTGHLDEASEMGWSLGLGSAAVIACGGALVRALHGEHDLRWMGGLFGRQPYLIPIMGAALAAWLDVLPGPGSAASAFARLGAEAPAWGVGVAVVLGLAGFAGGRGFGLAFAGTPRWRSDRPLHDAMTGALLPAAGLTGAAWWGLSGVAGWDPIATPLGFWPHLFAASGAAAGFLRFRRGVSEGRGGSGLRRALEWMRVAAPLEVWGRRVITGLARLLGQILSIVDPWILDPLSSLPRGALEWLGRILTPIPGRRPVRRLAVGVLSIVGALAWVLR